MEDQAAFLAAWNSPCVCCGAEPPDGGGVDRIDSSMGYKPSNIQSLCWKCNRAKQKDSQAEFAWWRTQIVRHWLWQNNMKAVPKG